MALVSNLHTVFGIFGCAASLFFFLAPMITLKRIFAKKSIEQFSLIPNHLTILHCLLSAWYALPPMSENNKLLAIANGTGAVIETIYLFMFMKFTPTKDQYKSKVFVSLMLLTLLTVVYISSISLDGKKSSRYFSGFAASIYSVIMYASPLAIMRTVIETKSVEFMPFFLSLSGFLYATCWFIFGLLGNDPFVYVCNGCGSVLCALQLILYHKYRNNKGGQKEPLETGVVKPPENATMKKDSENTTMKKDSENATMKKDSEKPPENATMEIEIRIVLKSCT